MFDRKLRSWIDPALLQIVDYLKRAGITPNHLTLIGFLFGILAALAVVGETLALAVIFLVLNRLADGLDGVMARSFHMESAGGAYLDIVLDFLFYGGFVFAFGLIEPDNALPAAFLIFSFVGTGASFYAYAAIAAKHDIKNQEVQKKGLDYLTGLIEGAETIIAFILFCLFPEVFPWLAYGFGSLCFVSTALRIQVALRLLGGHR